MTLAFNSRRFAKKVKTGASGSRREDDSEKSCALCGQTTMATQELPAGLKFDPSDKEILDHLAAKIGRSSSKPLLIDEYILTLDGDDGICCTHPEKLPGVKGDGTSSHFFHRQSNAYTKGTRKRRKILDDSVSGETRWHKTGKTRAVQENGKTIGWKKILVLYTNFKKNAKARRTQWVMHQYHLGSNVDEKEGELVVSKVFYQTQPRSLGNGKRKLSEYDRDERDDGPPSELEDTDEVPTNQEAEDPFSAPPGQLPSTPDVVRPCPVREALFDILPPVSETESTPSAAESPNVRTPKSTVSIVRCTTSAADLLCDENLGVDLTCGDLNQNFHSSAMELGLSWNDQWDVNDLDVLDAFQDFSSQEMRDWYPNPSSQEEKEDSQDEEFIGES